MKVVLAMCAATLLLATACATTGDAQAPDYWRNAAGGGRASFASDNQSCSSRASRVVPIHGRPDSVASGVTVSRNRIDRPPEKWVNAVAERAYMECMADLGWSPVAR